MSDRKRKLAGVLSLGALAAGAGSTASATWYNPLSWGVGEKLKTASENVKTLIKGSEIYRADNKIYNEIEIKKGYAAAINIAERIYNVLKTSEEKNKLIDKLKELCTNGNTINEQSKNLEENLKKPEFSESISSYASFLISIAHEIGIDKDSIEDFFKKNIGENYAEAKVESRLGIKKIVDGEVTLSEENESYSILVGQTLTPSKKSTDNLLFEYISKTEFNNERALLKAIENIEREIFNLKKDDDGSKAKKLIASLIINKYKSDKNEESYNKIIDELLDLEGNNKDSEDKEFIYSNYVTSFMNEKIEKIGLKVDKIDLDYILSHATSNEQADNIFSEKTKNFVKSIADNKIIRLAVTGAGLYFGGMVLAPVLGLGLVGTTVLASGTASAANAAIDYISDENARSSNSWSVSGISARYSSLSTRIPMTLAAISASTIIGAVRSLSSALFSSGKQ